MGLGVYANDFHIWAHLSHCRRLSQAPYPHANTLAWVYMQMISIFGYTCHTVAGFFRAYIPSCQYMGLGVYANDFHIWAHLSHCRRLFQGLYTLMPIHGPGCICKWFPYLGTPVALSQALSSQYMGPGVYANGFHIWAHRPVALSQAFSGPIPPSQYI